MKFDHVFNLSLHRNGTQSVHDLMCRSELSAVHWPKTFRDIDYEVKLEGHEHDINHIVETLAPILDAVVAISDIPIPILYQALNERYRRSAFLLALRPPEDWIRSVRRLLGDSTLTVFERMQYWQYLEGKPSSLRYVSDEALLRLYRTHVQAVCDYFTGSNNLLIFNLNDPYAGEKVCEFLGIPALPLGNQDYFRRI